MRKRISLLVFVIVDLLVLLAVILITFTSTKDYYTVEFNLNGGVLLSGNLKQTVKFGQSAIPPKVSKDGETFLEWSDDYHNVTENKVIYAIWDFKTTFGIQFDVYGEGNYCLVSGSFSDISGDVYISAYYGDKRVLGVKDYAFLNRSRMTSISLPSGIYSIGKQTFKGCSSLLSIKLPDSLVNIDEEAFAGCTSLSELTLPETVVSIGSNAFNDCANIKTINLGSKVEEITGESFSNMVSLESITVSEDNPYFTTIDGNLYTKDCKTLIKYASGKTDEVFNMPEGVEVISEYAFDNAQNLKKINISNELYDIKANGIYQCENVEYTSIDGIQYIGNENNPYLILLSVEEITNSNLVLPDGVKIIYANAFKDCLDLTSITMGQGLTSISDAAFSGCTNLESIKMPTSLISLGDSIFYNCSSLTSIELPTGITEIPSKAFYECVSLNSIVLSKNLKLIGESAFFNCSNLEKLDLPNCIEEIGDNALEGCTGISEINVPISVKKIGRGFIKNCTSLEKLTVPFIGSEEDALNATHFGYFFGTLRMSTNNTLIPTSLKTVIITNATTIESSAFYYCKNIEELYLPNTLREVGKSAFLGCANLKDVYFSGTSSDWCKISFGDITALPNYYHKTIYFLTKNNEYALVEELILSDSVSTIHDYQFSNFGNLKRVVISNSIKEIPTYTFRQCEALQYVYIGDNVESIYSDAFNFCSSIQEFDVSTNNNYLMSNNGNIYSKDGKTLLLVNNNPSNMNFVVLDGVERIESYAFYNHGVQSIIFPSSLKSIGEYAFYSCINLQDFVLPESLEKIEKNAFYSCKNIKSVVIPNKVTSIGEYAFYGCTKLAELYIPISVNNIGRNVINRCPLVTIKCETESFPEGWDPNWAIGYYELIWDVNNL